jgi:hypothetical protein
MANEGAQPENVQEQKTQSVSNAAPEKKSDNKPTTQLVNNREEAADQKKLSAIANSGSEDNNMTQLKAMASAYSSKQASPIQRKENNTGLPDNLKSGMENLSGMSLDDVKVHRNSDQPAQLQAHAYAQGTDIHLGPGQEKHLPHEAWHVVQQKQGRVQPTTQLKGKVNINDDAGLEKEADVMGAKAASAKNEGPVQAKIMLTASGNVAQREGVVEDNSDSADRFNETMKAGSGFVPVAYGGKLDNKHTNNSGIASDFLDGANAFKNAYFAGKKFWADNPKEMAKGAAVLAEGSKGILAVIKASIGSSGASKGVKDSAGTIIPGIGAAIGAFQNVMSIMQNQATWELVKSLDTGTLSDKEKEKVGSFVKRLDAKLGLDIVDFIFNIAEFIAMFTGTGPAVALIHSSFNLFKGACEVAHGYFVAKGVQADQRVTGGDGEVDREAMAALDLHLKESDKGDAKPSKSIFGLIKSYGAIKALKAVISAGAQQKPPDEDKLQKDRTMLALRERVLKLDLAGYNKNYKPDQVSDPKALLYGKVDVPPLTEQQIPTLYKIHMNVIRTIIKQAHAGAHGYSKLKAMTFGVKKDEIFQALEKKLGVPIDDSLDDWKLLSAMDPEQASYFNDKTKTAIHVASKRKYFGDDEIAVNLQEILIAQKDKFLPSLAGSDPSSFKDPMESGAYAAAVRKKVKF